LETAGVEFIDENGTGPGSAAKKRNNTENANKIGRLEKGVAEFRHGPHCPSHNQAIACVDRRHREFVAHSLCVVCGQKTIGCPPSALPNRSTPEEKVDEFTVPPCRDTMESFIAAATKRGREDAGIDAYHIARDLWHNTIQTVGPAAKEHPSRGRCGRRSHHLLPVLRNMTVLREYRLEADQKAPPTVE